MYHTVLEKRGYASIWKYFYHKCETHYNYFIRLHSYLQPSIYQNSIIFFHCMQSVSIHATIYASGDIPVLDSGFFNKTSDFLKQ